MNGNRDDAVIIQMAKRMLTHCSMLIELCEEWSAVQPRPSSKKKKHKNKSKLSEK